MTVDETIEILALVVSNDRRTVGEADVLLWSGVLKDVSYQDAADAVIWHATNSPGEWLTPAHIVQRVRQVHRTRLQDAGRVPDYPTGLSQLEEKRYRELWQEQVRCGATAAQAQVQVDAVLGYKRGELVSRPVAQAIEGMFSTRRAS
jgi:hypothetical protein